MKYNSLKIELAAFLLFIFAVGVLYYNMYVVPREHMLNAVMDCMIQSNDMSEDRYLTCHDEYIASAPHF